MAIDPRIVLTQARLACWEAVDNYAPLDGLFSSKFKYLKSIPVGYAIADDGVDRDLGQTPNHALMPCLDIWPVFFDSPVKHHPAGIDVDLQMKFQIFTAGSEAVDGWDPYEADRRYQLVIESLYNSGPAATYLEARGCQIKKPGQARFRRASSGSSTQHVGHKCVEALWLMHLTVEFNPLDVD